MAKMRSMLVTLLAARCSAAPAAPQDKPHIMTLVIDDLGWHDTQIHNPNSFMTPNLGALAKAGITLMRHHTYKFCSPTRRSILCGRFPVHITGVQAPVCSNYLPLKFTLLPEKLKKVHTSDTARVPAGLLSVPAARRFLCLPELRSLLSPQAG
eukprot:COSAG05_NODE_11252_length_523_cov_0.537736_1_plen_152_part_01